ncbi:MAG: histidinol-phosphate transaminase [Rhizobacter sp.]|nr:histidinol-phosphate transaminase [Rhizobacter sp.]
MPRTALDVIQRFIRQDVQSMHGYAIQPSAGMVKLDAMENPFTLPEALRHELGQRLGEVAINRYPGARIDELRGALARHVGLPEGYELILGNGSDEIITLLTMACDTPGATVLAPVPGFVMYDVSARLQGLQFIGVPLTADFELDEVAMLAAVNQHQPAIVYIAYPNNPTANLFDDAVIEKIIQAAPGLVVIDEAYQPFASRSYLDRLVDPTSRHEHVLIMRTLSKFGLAGVRLGYLLGPKALVDQIDKVRPPYNVSVLNAEAALFALEHHDEFAHQASVLRSERKRLTEALAAMPGVTPYPSEANMVLTRVPDAAVLFDALKRHNVLVKNVSKLHPLLANCLRLTVGTPEENDLMIDALKVSLS